MSCSHESYTNACKIIFKDKNQKQNINSRLDDVASDLAGLGADEREEYFVNLIECAEKRVCNAEKVRHNKIDDAHRNVINRILGRVGAYVNIINIKLPLQNTKYLQQRLADLRVRTKNLQPETLENTPRKSLFESPSTLQSPSPLQSPSRPPMRNITLRKMRL